VSVLRTSVAVAAGKAIRVGSRLRGGGSAFPGLVVEKLDPRFLTHSLSDLPRGVVVVTGTNGKTTTTKMLVAILREHGLRVFTNPTGSNFTRGVISSMLAEVPLSGRLRADLAVLELDEAHALKFAAEVKPAYSLLLNVARDQLDRFAEIDHTAKLLAALAEQTTQGVVLNLNDSFVSRIAGKVHDGVKVSYFGVDPSIADRPTSGSRTTSPRPSPRSPTGCSSRTTSAASRYVSVSLTGSARWSSSNGGWLP